MYVYVYMYTTGCKLRTLRLAELFCKSTLHEGDLAPPMFRVQGMFVCSIRYVCSSPMVVSFVYKETPLIFLVCGWATSLL